ncbi:hypothetical protein [Asticcacaulis sp. EMRT-3]|uniref:hypothetical protein n=1 Tax=Asticcacaulis sp. EMRT-3 TaxID=3040349 RepID=UPI0024AF75E2|nr:hypothetical protein [Asticcacaulis sp. EMRT-3]MDI7775525.1 hypothetical protein [Asticcacaulis sp. EMRT-3]
MSDRPVHYEVFSRRTPQASWVLEMAVESRDTALTSAEEMLKEGRAAVRVSKETFDPETGEFRSHRLMEKGVTTPQKKPKLAPETDSVCVSPQDLYTGPAREKIGRLLEDWLRRYEVTPFELLHRPDLAEKLEASGNDLLHVTQKLSVPESQDTGVPLHELIRRWQGLFDRACTRLIQDGRKQVFPELTPANLLAVVDRLRDHPERDYVLGGGLAGLLKEAKRPAAKLEALRIYAEALSGVVQDRNWAMQVIEAPVVEIFATRGSLADLVGDELDLGGALALLTRLAAGAEVDLVARHDARVARLMPSLSGTLAGYAALIQGGHLPHLAYHISRRCITELKGPRRLCPNDPETEIETLRALALCLSAAGKDEGQRDDIKEAFVERSKKLVSADFVTSLMEEARDATDEVEKLIWLCENMVGAANKRQAARWLQTFVSQQKFERSLRESQQPPAARLQTLARMQARIKAAQLVEKDGDDICVRLGQIGGLIAADVKLLAHILRSPASPVQKLAMMMGFAAGQTGPMGPLSDQARSEAMKMLRDSAVRQALMGQPQVLASLRPMMQAAGLAA